MNTIHYLYEYSLNFFMDTFINLLTKNEELQKISRDKLKERRKMIFDLIFKIIFSKLNNSMLSKDKLVFGLKLT